MVCHRFSNSLELLSRQFYTSIVMALSERMTKHIVQRSISEIIDVAASVPNVRLLIIKLGVVAQTVILALGEPGQED